MVFVLSELGDLYRVSFEVSGTDVKSMKVSYFDTVAPLVQMNVLESGFLFAAADCSNHRIYRFTSLGDEDEDDPE